VSDHGPTTLPADERLNLGDLGPKITKIGAGVGVLFLVVAFLLKGTGEHAYEKLGLAYTAAFSFFLSLTLGALFFTVIQHLTRAGWSVVIRRVTELMGANVITLGILAIPMLLLATRTYGWSHAPEDHHFRWGKDQWLTVGFFSGRIVLYFAIWGAMAWWYLRKSVAQDSSGERSLTKQMQGISGLCVVIFALSMSAGAFDILMSLDAHWFSTMFGVYFFAGGMLSFFATLILILRFLQGRGLLKGAVTVEHYHDLGKWLFGFTFFWGYIAFSQYMLIWYGNLPEETEWFAKRGASMAKATDTAAFWGWWAVILMFGHFLIPFPGLLSRHVKRCLTSLSFWAVWILVFHLADMIWLTIPELGAEGASGQLPLVICCWLGVGGIWLAGLAYLAADRSLLPVKDPRLGESLAFENY